MACIAPGLPYLPSIRSASDSRHNGHPSLGKISPISAFIPTSESVASAYECVNALPDADTVFEVGLSSVPGLYDHMDFDCDGNGFRTDDDEIIVLDAGLFFEGYFEDGTGFGSGFPMPLHLRMSLRHGTP